MENIVAGVAAPLAPGLSRVTAPNPGVMTGPGTNAYIVGNEELVLIDPGPDIGLHLATLVQEVGTRLKWILCTHTHRDHSPAAGALKTRTAASTAGMAAPADERHDQHFKPDRVLRDGDVIECPGVTLRAIHTPGHSSEHLCYLWQERGLLFTGDHIMQGSTVVIAPPDGDMALYLKSLERLLDIDIAQLAPGHGHLIDTPHEEVRRLIAHRLKREEKAYGAVQAVPGGTIEELVGRAYDDTPVRLHAIAQRSLHAHLIKLQADRRVREDGGHWHPA